MLRNNFRVTKKFLISEFDCIFSDLVLTYARTSEEMDEAIHKKYFQYFHKGAQELGVKLKGFYVVTPIEMANLEC